MTGRGGGGGGRRGVSYTTQEEPAFIKRFKEKIGYREDGPDIDSKRSGASNESDEDDDFVAEENKPQVVVLRAGDLTAEEAEKLGVLNEETAETEAAPPSDGRILFKKPIKRTNEEGTGGIVSSSSNCKKSKMMSSTKKTISADDSDEASEGSHSKKKVASANLLSFNEDDDD